jgi:hypothetical protein
MISHWHPNTFLMTPAQHFAQAEMLRKAPTPKTLELTRAHDELAKVMEHRQRL